MFNTKPKQLNLRVIAESLFAATPTDVVTMDVEEHGEVRFVYSPDYRIMRFVKYDRVFSLYPDGVLVEKMATPPPVVRPDEVLDESAWLRFTVSRGKHPEVDGDTKLYRMPHDKMCTITRIKRGLLAEFLGTDVKLYYDLANHKIRDYVVPPVTELRQTMLQKEKEKAAIVVPRMVTQLGYHGEDEHVDTNVYKHKIQCACGNVRWIKPSDIFQCHACKPCTKKNRNRKRVLKHREGGQ